MMNEIDKPESDDDLEITREVQSHPESQKELPFEEEDDKFEEVPDEEPEDLSEQHK
jgi:hypothetical protein